MKKVKVEVARKERSDKKTRVNAALNQDTHEKLKKLAISCDMPKTILAAHMIEFVVNHPDLIKFYQDQFNTDDQYRIRPINQGGKIYY
ncbi:hypothetical protein [Geomicrobium sediminis]|uniref:CopG family transcriptional regulator n=1 Tax=Geomicrobium sediminis TaxID=1347788 RepID=A0ABS2PG21_9BACL|nr:hypothetical protein [Geomicrobium sediminis]MBM7634197.1 hypothetical protein [Geomicrobium sediminis]